jgi:hypothetical protein
MRHKVLFAAFLAVFVSACVPPPPPGAVFVRVRPPGARVEVVGVEPGPGHIWVAGYHEWRGGEYVWVPGHWATPPHPRYHRWVPGHWREHRNGWYWVEGHWN